MMVKLVNFKSKHEAQSVKDRVMAELRKGPRTLRQLTDAVYAHDPDGGPPYAEAIVRRAARILQQQGHHIRSVQYLALGDPKALEPFVQPWYSDTTSSGRRASNG